MTGRTADLITGMVRAAAMTTTIAMGTLT